MPEIIRVTLDYDVILDDGKNPKQSIGRTRYVHKARVTRYVHKARVSTGRARGSWAAVHGASKTATKIVIPAAPKVSTWSRAIGSHSFADGLLVEKVLDPNDDLRKNLFDGRYAAASIAGSTYPTLVAKKK